MFDKSVGLCVPTWTQIELEISPGSVPQYFFPSWNPQIWALSLHLKIKISILYVYDFNKFHFQLRTPHPDQVQPQPVHFNDYQRQHLRYERSYDMEKKEFRPSQLSAIDGRNVSPLKRCWIWTVFLFYSTFYILLLIKKVCVRSFEYNLESYLNQDLLK